MTTVPTARLCDTEAEKKARLRRASKLRPIDKGTVYDIVGKLRKIVHQIEKGELGNVTDLAIVMRVVKDNKTKLQTAWLGSSQPEILHYMASFLEREIMQ